VVTAHSQLKNRSEKEERARANKSWYVTDPKCLGICALERVLNIKMPQCPQFHSISCCETFGSDDAFFMNGSLFLSQYTHVGGEIEHFGFSIEICFEVWTSLTLCIKQTFIHHLQQDVLADLHNRSSEIHGQRTPHFSKIRNVPLISFRKSSKISSTCQTCMWISGWLNGGVTV